MSTFSASIGRWPTLDDFPALRSHTDEELKLRGLAPDMVADEVLRFYLTFLFLLLFFYHFLFRAIVMRSELSPVCAILGGMIGQEVVKAISGVDKPVNNFFFYDALVSGTGSIRRIG